MSAAIILVGSALLFLLCWRRWGMLHPLTVTLALWLVIGLLLVIRPVELYEPSPRIAVAIVSGLTALIAVPLLFDRTPRPGDDDAAADPPVRVSVRVGRLAVATAVVLAVVLWGSWQYRQAVSSVLGVPFGQLDSKLVRWAELYGNLVIPTPVGIAQALAPLLGAFGVIGGLCHRWWWFLLIPVAIATTMQSPSRTATLTLVVTSLFFLVLLPRAAGLVRRHRRRILPPGVRVAALVSLVGGAALAYFGFVGQQLDKGALPPGLVVSGWLPDSLVQPLLYQVGGVSAFSVAVDQSTGGAGPYGAWGRSLYAVVKSLQFFGVPLPTPQPFADYVDMPIPFNTYTAFGDAYFDFGLAGVVAVFLLAGLVVHLLGTWPRPGHPGSIWAMSVMAAVLTATPIHGRLLDIDVLVPAVTGWLLVTWVLRPERTPPAAAPQPTAAALAGEERALR
ncbi:O-antigen polymerase [Modestobacter excelsi]|uniref:O-antigen polymerase n=1 Tax=Modestobacter excelsi TaxID=2213161 RepID=UPI001C20DCAC|nr:O-antigen polymerase [Modestobacter excelsi]